MIKQLQVVDVNAVSEEQALNIVKKQLDPKALVELSVIDEVQVKEINRGDHNS